MTSVVFSLHPVFERDIEVSKSPNYKRSAAQSYRDKYADTAGETESKPLKATEVLVGKASQSAVAAVETDDPYEITEDTERRLDARDWKRRVFDFCADMGWPEPSYVGCGVYVGIFTIEPYQAAEIMEHHHIAGNRRTKPKKIAAYLNDMTHDRWRVTHQGIAFDHHMEMYDGQNRCSAGIESDSPFLSMVTFLPESVASVAMKVADSGVPRNFCDAARISGHQVSTRYPSIVRCIANGISYEAMSHQAIAACGEIVQDAVDFTFECFPSHLAGITNRGMMGAFGRAFYHVPQDRLREFAKAVNTGVVEKPEDSAAVALVRYMTIRRGRGKEDGSSVYRRTQSALSYFAQRKPMEKLHAAADELFPLPKHIQDRLDEVK